MPDINVEDILSRFILESNRYSSTKNSVKFNAFMPNPSGELSVFVITNWPEEKVWKAGQDYVAQPQRKSLKARGDIEVSVVHENDLTVDRDNSPPGHANVLGWPDINNKEKQKAIAIKLAKVAKLSIFPGD